MHVHLDLRRAPHLHDEQRDPAERESSADEAEAWVRPTRDHGPHPADEERGRREGEHPARAPPYVLLTTSNTPGQP